MTKILIAAVAAGFALLILSVLGIYATIHLFPGIATEYFDPAYDTQSSRIMAYYMHPFVISLALSLFWQRFKAVLNGSFLTRGIEFGLIYVGIATVPMLWLIYSAMSVSLAVVATWFVLALCQGLIAGLIFEKINP